MTNLDPVIRRLSDHLNRKSDAAITSASSTLSAEATREAARTASEATSAASAALSAHTGRTDNPHSVTAAQTGAEPSLGNPGVTGHVLSSTDAGIRSWIEMTAPTLGNELTALQALADTAGFLKKDGDGAYSIDTSAYSLTSHTHAFADLTSKPTTLAGYGITETYLPLTGGTLTGNAGISTASSAGFTVSGAAGQVRDVMFSTANSPRWIWRTSADAESGSDAGSNFQLISRTDAGAFKTTVLNVSRATGAIAIEGNVSLGAGKTLTVTPNATGHSSGLTVVNGDLTVYRSGGTSGVVYLNNTGTRYLYYDGTQYRLPYGELLIGAAPYTALHTGNYNSYAPTLTGTGASGSWNITATNATNVYQGNAGSSGIYKLLMGNGTNAIAAVYNVSGLYYDASNGMLTANITGNAATATSATNATYSQYLWSTTHSGTYYVKAAWTGTYWHLSSNHASPVSCGYATDAGGFAAAAVASSNFTVNGVMGIRTALWGSAALQIRGPGTGGTTYSLIAMDSAGNNSLYATDSGGVYLRGAVAVTSDRRKKKDIQDLDNPLATILALRPRSFRMIDDEEGRLRHGVVAQEAIDAVPDAVQLVTHPGHSEPEYTMDYIELLAPLIGAVQQLEARIARIEAESEP